MDISTVDIRFNWLSSLILAIAVVVQVAALVLVVVAFRDPSTEASNAVMALTSLAVLIALIGFFAGLALNLSRRARRR